MEWLFIIVGLLLVIGAVFALLMTKGSTQGALTHKEVVIHEKSTTYPSRPEPPFHKTAAYTIAALCFLFAVPCFSYGQTGIVIGAALAGAGICLVVAGRNADQRERDNIQARTQTKQSEVQYEKALTELESARNNAQLQKIYNEKENETRILQQGLAQQQIAQNNRELGLRSEYVSVAREYKVGVDDVIRINTQKILDDLEIVKKQRLDELETKKAWDEIQNRLRAGDQLLLTANKQIKDIYNDLEEVVGKLIEVEESTKPEYAKKILRKPINSQIKLLTRQINDAQNGLHQNQNGKKPGGKRSRDTDSGADYPPETDED
jgi:hypothetical protein